MNLNKTAKNLLLVSSFFGTSNLCTAQASRIPDTLAQNGISREMFCSKTHRYLDSVFTQSELNVTAQDLAKSTIGLIEYLRQGNIAEYISLGQLTGETSQNRFSSKYIGLAQLLTESLSLNPTRPVILVMGESDLRFLPNTQENSQIVLLLQNTDLLKNENILNSVITTAQRLKISINVLWTGPSDSILVATKLADNTKGVFLDLASTKNICSP